MTIDEIKIRQLTNQHLLSPTDELTVVRDLCGVQAQFMSGALHALGIRRGGEPSIEGLVKSWTNRGTMHVFAESDLPLFLHRGRSHYLRPRDQFVSDDCVTLERKRYFADLIVEKIGEGVDEREALKAACFAAGMTEREAESVFDPWGGTIRALCECGRICHKVQEKKAYRLCPAFEPMEEDPARLELARRYFAHIGPATVRDAAYFFGTTQAKVKGWLDRLPVSSVEWKGKTYFYIENGEDYSGGIPACLFLAGFDQLMLAYRKEESLYLPTEHLRGIFSLAGIVMPAVLLRGRVVGKWKRKGKKLTVTLFESVSREGKSAIGSAARALWGDGTEPVFEGEG